MLVCRGRMGRLYPVTASMQTVPWHQYEGLYGLNLQYPAIQLCTVIAGTR